MSCSGVKVCDHVVTEYNDMKMKKQSTKGGRRKKAMLFCFSEDLKTIICEKDKEILVSCNDETEEDPYSRFIKLLPPEECRYALYDASYETKESKKEDLVFVFWTPDKAPIKCKMLYASSKDAIKKKFTGIKHDWQVTEMSDLKDRCNLAEKLGGDVVSLEGKPL